MKYGGRPVRHLEFVGRSHWTTHEGPFIVGISCKNFVMIGNVECSNVEGMCLVVCRSHLKVLFIGLA